MPRELELWSSKLTKALQGPVAVPAHKLDKVLKVQTYVNGELRQNATTDDLICSIPYLLMTMSEVQTLMPGDILATGTVSNEAPLCFSKASGLHCSDSLPA